jgi:uncharacterized protein YecE (DUF72 family)
MSSWYLGTIGFSYKDWVGEFYPKGTSQCEYLPYYCKVLNSVELDTTFHSIPRPSIVQSWFQSSPDDFLFCLKTPRAITHEQGLKGSEGLMDEFIDAISPLQYKTGPILLQLPPSYDNDNYPSLQKFLEQLSPSNRYAIELRHPSWYNEKTKQLLSEYRVCWVSLDFPNLPRLIFPTTDFLYIRWIGINNLYHRHSFERVDKSNELREWVKTIHPFLDQIPRMYGFFNNDYTGFAAGTCKRFMRLVGLSTHEPDTPYQARLF